MYKKKKILCIIPARIGSKGLKFKNIKKINNKELFMYPLTAAKNSKFIDDIFVSSDSELILKKSKKNGVNFSIKRPKKLCGNKISSYQVIHYVIEYLKKIKKFYDYLICLEPTSPLTDSNDIDLAIKKIVSKSNMDSCISISRAINFHPYNLYKIDKDILSSLFQNESKQIRRQDLDKIYFIDGSLYISKIDSILKYRNFVSGNVIPFIVSKKKSFEIDDEIDFEIVKTLIKNKKL